MNKSLLQVVSSETDPGAFDVFILAKPGAIAQLARDIAEVAILRTAETQGGALDAVRKDLAKAIAARLKGGAP